MSFKDIWRPRIDGVDDADSSAVNEIAEAVINNENFINNAPNKYYNKESVNNLFANALKGSASGEAVALKDVSPLEHNLGVVVKSKNLFDVSKVKTSGDSTLINNGDGTITVKNKGGKLCGSTFGEMCPDLKVGDVFTLSLRVTNAVEDTKQGTFIYLVEIEKSVTSGTSLTTTQDMLNSNVYLYTSTSANQNNVTDGVVSEIQVEIDTKATPYTPHIADTSGVRVLTYGGNLLDVSKTGDTAGNNYETYDKETNTITAKSANYAGWGSINALTPLLPAGTYTIFKGKEYRSEVQLFNKNLEILAQYLNYDLSSRIVITATEPFYLKMKYFFGVTYPYTASATDFKLVAGDVSEADYEPYKEPIEYAQGEDIKSIAPCTTIMTDTAGAVLTVEYNKDANKVVKSLEDRISALEAMIVSQ